MFFERPNSSNVRSGWIEVICGSMFSGKTEELIRRLKRAKIAKQRVEIYKPKVDIRYDEINVVSHDENKITSTPVETASEILFYAGDVDVVGIDEAQFFDNELANVCNQLADRGIRVIVAGLDMDYLRHPFGPMPDLIACAEYVDKVHAVCVKCGNLAQYSHRTAAETKQVLLGETDSYEPLCRKCYNEAQKKKDVE
ncbi:MAG: thymidine kinase [Bacteroidales bacterium]|jgi:thymidine kinase|nr:thymidine kinase [Bacteroidales bacterium]MDD2203968.1 thymidine kinase [Bacteroidales bacterium]MDD3151909.1 thymidine kinase [Bacteroidales bacterium]MDD3913443.1 thymidine kinase [Bacteroidales bacterium]MDD4633239.1 thymidine kinase [Bacteroidales bacterium]